MSTMAPLALILAASATSPALAAKVDSSANHFLQRCRAVVDREIDQHFDIGICSGVMIAIHDVSILLHVPPDHQLRSCLPESVTVEQSVAVVVRWLDRRPHRWDENFVKLAMSALHETWPCIE
jgi:Rap1a immunity proteins